MAHITAEQVKEKRNAIKALLKDEKRKMKVSVTRQHGSTINVTIQNGLTDEELLHICEQRAKNQWIKENNENPELSILESIQKSGIQYSPSYMHRETVPEILKKIANVIENKGKVNHDNSDSMTDYFDVGFYSYLNVGSYEKPYQFN